MKLGMAAYVCNFLELVFANFAVRFAPCILLEWHVLLEGDDLLERDGGLFSCAQLIGLRMIAQATVFLLLLNVFIVYHDVPLNMTYLYLGEYVMDIGFLAL